MATASAFNATLTGRVEINRAVSIPVPGLPEATNVILVSELLNRLSAAERRIVLLEAVNERLSKKTPEHRHTVEARAQRRHRVGNTDEPAGVLPTYEEDLFPVHDEDAGSELVREIATGASIASA